MESKTRNRMVVNTSIIGLISQLVKTLSTLISRKFFVAYLGIELLGINGVLNNILNMLQLTELGIGAAVVYGLYEPIVNGDKKTIIHLMNIYKKLYTKIGIAIIAIGLGLSYSLSFFIETDIYSSDYISKSFYILLFSTAATYFLSYKRQLLYADQKQYIYTIVDTIINVICCILQVYAIIVYNSYLLYLSVQIIQVFASNIIVLYICDKIYPFLNQKIEGSYEKKVELTRNVKDVFIGKIGGYIYSSTDNLVISKLVNVAAVGYLTNYTYITSVCKTLTSSLVAPLRPIIGNYIREQNGMKSIENIFNVYSFIMYCIASVVVPGVIVLSDTFINLWLGEGYVVSGAIIYLLAFDLYVHLVHSPTGEFLTVLGYFRYDKVFSLIGMVINLFVSVILAFKFGVVGVLIGTALSQIFYWIARSYCLYKKYFKTEYFNYIKRMIAYMATNVFQIILLKKIVSSITTGTKIGTFLISFILVIMLSLIYVILLWWNSVECRDVRRRITNIIADK